MWKIPNHTPKYKLYKIHSLEYHGIKITANKNENETFAGNITTTPSHHHHASSFRARFCLAKLWIF